MSNKIEFKKTGILKIPVDPKQIASVIHWLKDKKTVEVSECPVDLGLFPDPPPSVDTMIEGKCFFIFREVEIEDGKIMFIYDRNKIVGGAPVESGSYKEQILEEQQQDDVFIDEVLSRLKSEHNVIISRPVLQRLALDHEDLRNITDPHDFVADLRNMGMFDVEARG